MVTYTLEQINDGYRDSSTICRGIIRFTEADR